MRIHSHLTTQSHMFNSETGTKKQTESFFIQTARLSRMVNALSPDNIKLPSEGFKKQDYVWLQTCCFGATVGGYSDAPLTPSSPSAASPSLVPWSHTVRLVRSQSCSPGIDGKRQCEKRGVWSSVSLRGMLMELSCHVGADVSRRKGRYTTSKTSPRVRLQWSSDDFKEPCEPMNIFCDPGEAISPSLSASTWSWYDFLSVTVPLSLWRSRTSRACYWLVFEAVGQRGLAVMSHTGRHTHRIHRQIWTNFANVSERRTCQCIRSGSD